ARTPNPRSRRRRAGPPRSPYGADDPSLPTLSLQVERAELFARRAAETQDHLGEPDRFRADTVEVHLVGRRDAPVQEIRRPGNVVRRWDAAASEEVLALARPDGVVAIAGGVRIERPQHTSGRGTSADQRGE